MSPAVELTPHLREFISLQAKRIRHFSGQITENAAMIGEALSEVKAKLGHGPWLSWIEHEFQWSDEHARNLINVYEWTKSNSKPVWNLPIDLSALYLLARPSTPAIAREQAIEMAEKGERVTKQAARNIVSFTGRPATKPPKRRTKEQIASDQAADARFANIAVMQGAVRDVVRIWRRAAKSELLADLLSERNGYMGKRFLDELPEALAVLVELKEAMQKSGALKPATFGVPRPVLMKAGKAS